MDDPANEVVSVATLVTAAINPEIQRETVLKYYTPDMKFRHPLCTISGGPNGRDAMLDVLQWYRIMSPVLKVRVNGVTYDKDRHTVYLDATQVFHIRLSPLRPAPARLIVLLKLRPEPSPTDPSKTLYYIEEQEDFYHPDDLAALVVPPLVPLIRAGLQLATLACRIQARIGSMLGYWTVQDGEGGKGVTLQPEGEPLPPISENEGVELQNVDRKKRKKD
ncbi:hypothetical protein C8Q80DRAFT_1347117 [Daedaleopsis nitida]|nr:hypothetical protein C8Q80DRAFT_1347117 [Daedaleopsis nitida]